MTDALTIDRPISLAALRLPAAPKRRASDDATLSGPCRAALMLMLSGTLEARRGHWVTPTGGLVMGNVFAALFDRRLVKITVESRHRKRQFGSLTEIGRHVANDLARQAEVARQIAGNAER